MLNHQEAPPQGLTASLSAMLLTRRWLLALLSLITAIALAAGIPRINFDSSLDALLTTSDPYLDEFEELDGFFPEQLEVTFLFIAAPGETVFTRPFVNALEDLKESFTAIPRAERVVTLLDYFSPETQTRLFNRYLDSYTDDELAALAGPATEDRLLTNNLLSRDGSMSFASVVLDARTADVDERLQIANAAIELRDAMRARHPGITLLINSDVLLEQSSRQAMVDDLTFLMPIVILVCVLTICGCFKSVSIGACILGHVLLTMLCTVGSLGWLGYEVNSISIIAPLVVVIIAVANSVHIISIFQQSAGRGADRFQAMAESLQHNLRPVSLAALTTAIGFASLNLCSSPAIQDFGQIVGIGIGFAYLLTLTLIPTLLVLVAGHIPAATSANAFLQQPMNALHRFTQRWDKSLFAFWTVLAVITAALLPLNETDFNRLDFIPADSDISRYYDLLNERIDRGPSLTYGIATDRPNGAVSPEFLKRVEAFNDWLVAQEGVESAASLVNVIKTINQFSNQNNPSAYVIPDDQGTVYNHLSGYQVVQSEDFPLSGFLNDDFSMMTLFVNAGPMTNQTLLELDEMLTERFRADFPDARLLHGSGVLLFARMDDLVTLELLQGYSVSLALITLALIIGLRSLYFGALSVIPNLLPATMIFGIWAVFVGQLDPFVMMLFSISIGMVVDDTVHLLSHYLTKRDSGLDQDEALGYAIRTAGPALSITTLVLALGTMILIAANTLYFQQAAKLLVPIVVLALVLDLLYLPSILRRFDRRETRVVS